MTPTYLIYRLDCGGYVLVDEEGSSAHYKALGEIFAEIARCEEPHGVASMVAIDAGSVQVARLTENTKHD